MNAKSLSFASVRSPRSARETKWNMNLIHLDSLVRLPFAFVPMPRTEQINYSKSWRLLENCVNKSIAKCFSVRLRTTNWRNPFRSIERASEWMCVACLPVLQLLWYVCVSANVTIDQYAFSGMADKLKVVAVWSWHWPTWKNRTRAERVLPTHTHAHTHTHRTTYSTLSTRWVPTPATAVWKAADGWRFDRSADQPTDRPTDQMIENR